VQIIGFKRRNAYVWEGMGALILYDSVLWNSVHSPLRKCAITRPWACGVRQGKEHGNIGEATAGACRQTDICCFGGICEVNALQQGLPSFKANLLFVGSGGIKASHVNTGPIISWRSSAQRLRLAAVWFLASPHLSSDDALDKKASFI
jgi:hypothetical protein